MSGLYYYVPDLMEPYSSAPADTRRPSVGVGIMKRQYLGVAAFVNPASGASTFAAVSSATDSVNVMLGSHGTQVITAPYMISAILIKRAKA